MDRLVVSARPAALQGIDLTQWHGFCAYNSSYLFHIPTSAVFQATPALTRLVRALKHDGQDGALEWETLCDLHEPGVIAEAMNALQAMHSSLEMVSIARPEGRQFIDQLVAHQPRNLMLFMTEKCNLACRYCYQHDVLRPGTGASAGKSPTDVPRAAPTDSDEGTVRAAIDRYIERSGCRTELTVTFFGGEALLNWKLLRFAVGYANDQGARYGKTICFSVTTNGTLLDDQAITFLTQHRFAVMVSIDGDEDEHNANRIFRSGVGSHGIVVSNVRALLARQLELGIPPVKLRATVTHGQSRTKARAFLESTFPGANICIGEADASNSMDISLVNDIITGEHHGLQAIGRFVESIDYLTATAAWREHRDVLDALLELHPYMVGNGHREELPLRCGVGRNMLAVGANGQYYPCHRFVGMDEFRLGDATAQPNQDALRRFYSRVLESFRAHCSSCWVRNICRGDCPHNLAHKSGAIGMPRAEKCDNWRIGWEHLIAAYWELHVRRPDIYSSFFGHEESCGEEGL